MADIRAFARLLSPKRLTAVVDVGANPIDGDPPYLPLLRNGLCDLTGFEPQEEALKELVAKKGPHETYLPYAVGDGGLATLNVCVSSGMTSLLEPDPATLSLFQVFGPLGQVVRRVPLQTRRLDDIAEIQAVDFLKMDVQGSELAVFKSGREKLARTVAIQTEVSFIPLYKNQPTLGDIDVEFRKAGFVPHCFAAVKHWMIAPCVRDGDPRKPLNQLLEADLVYVRDFSRPENLDEEQLKHLALIADHCYGSYDLALRCIVMLQERGALPQGARERYFELLAQRGTA